MIKDLYFCFCSKTQYLFIINYRRAGEEIWGVLINGIGVKLLRYLNMWLMLFWRHSLIKIA